MTKNGNKMSYGNKMNYDNNNGNKMNYDNYGNNYDNSGNNYDNSYSHGYDNYGNKMSYGNNNDNNYYDNSDNNDHDVYDNSGYDNSYNNNYDSYGNKMSYGNNYDNNNGYSAEYFVSQEKLTEIEARNFCKSNYSSLVDVDAFNQKNINIFLKSKDVDVSWINSWNGDKYRESCISMTSSYSKNYGSGAITENDCNEYYQALCSTY